MKAKAVRLHGKNDLRLEEFELPQIREDEILAHIYSDSICMSSYKTVIQGADHKRVHHDVAENPAIIGHEMSGVITKVGEKWAHKYREGQKFIMQTALNYKGTLYAPGYSYPYCGGCATDIVIPNEVMLMDCLIPYEGEAYYYGSICEPLSCIIGSFHATYHTEQGKYIHKMDIKPGGKLALLGGAGPMGLATIDYAIHREVHPGKMIVTDFNGERLERAKRLLPPEEAAKRGIDLSFS